MNAPNETTALRILQAAEQEFMDKGYAGAKTVEIARQAGVTHAMLHYYYRTKELLFQQVFEQKIGLLAESFIEAFHTPGQSFEERLKAGIARHFDFLAENTSLPRFVVNELISKPEHLELVRRNLGGNLQRVFGVVQAEIDKLVAEGRIAPIDVSDLFIDIVSLNAFAFMLFPAMEPFVLQIHKSREDFFESRKQENIEVIMRRIHPIPDLT